MHAKRLDKTPAASVRGDPGVGKTTLLDHQWISLNDGPGFALELARYLKMSGCGLVPPARPQSYQGVGDRVIQRVITRSAASGRGGWHGRERVLGRPSGNPFLELRKSGVC